MGSRDEAQGAARHMEGAARAAMLDQQRADRDLRASRRAAAGALLLPVHEMARRVYLEYMGSFTARFSGHRISPAVSPLVLEGNRG